MTNPRSKSQPSSFAITIGINQYEFFQPLSYAQQDAQALHHFFVNQAGFAADQCFLLTETAAFTQEQSTYPSRVILQGWIKDLWRRQIQPGDIVWCFFSGYGVSFQGDDYLMPVDGNLADIPGTGILLRSLLESLQATQAGLVVVLLDMSRSSLLQPQFIPGENTLALAKELGIAMVLSCQPDEVAYEVRTLRHGLFTAALLEGLRSGQATTLADLEIYLRDRVPQMAEHHWRPVQHPVVVYPTAQADQMLLATPAQPPGSLDSPDSLGLTTAPTSVPISAPQRVFRSGSPVAPPRSPEVSEPTRSQVKFNPSSAANSSPTGDTRGTNSQPPLNPPQVASGSTASLPTPVPIPMSNPNQPSPTLPEDTSESELEDSRFWQRLFLWGGGMILVLLLGVILRNLPVFTGQSASAPGTSPTASSSPPGTLPPAGTVQPPVAPPLQPAQQAIQNEQPQEALRLLDQVPPAQRTNEFTTLYTRAQQQANQALLEEARMVIQPLQASRLQDAIQLARQVKPGQPLYEQAQQDIARWSTLIMDIAEGRARIGNYTGAIAAARLVPDSQGELSVGAKQAIAQWQAQAQQQEANQKIITTAQNLIQPAQASSYNRAIEVLRQIPAGQPKSLEAQRLRNQWSQRIWEIAQQRANRGNLSGAIQTALLVPENTPVYAPAQKAITTWRRRISQ